jgi:hypothetical protein
MEDMVRDQRYTDGTLHISVVSVMLWVNINEYEFMKQNRSYVLSDRWTHTQYKEVIYETASRTARKS